MIYYIPISDNVRFVCEYEFDEFEAAVLEGGVQVEPEWPARVRVGAIRLSNIDIDINSILSDDFIQEIEKQILEDNHQ